VQLKKNGKTYLAKSVGRGYNKSARLIIIIRVKGDYK